MANDGQTREDADGDGIESEMLSDYGRIDWLFRTVSGRRAELRLFIDYIGVRIGYCLTGEEEFVTVWEFWIFIDSACLIQQYNRVNKSLF